MSKQKRGDQHTQKKRYTIHNIIGVYNNRTPEPSERKKNSTRLDKQNVARTSLHNTTKNGCLQQRQEQEDPQE